MRPSTAAPRAARSASSARAERPTSTAACSNILRNSAFNANTPTRNKSASTNFTSPFRYNQFGYNIGGPFYIPGHFNKDKNKFFFFWGQEWLRYRFTDTQTQTVPTDLMRNGDFSELAESRTIRSIPEAATVYDPATCPTVGAATCAPFPDNVIPQDRLSPNGIGLLRAYPAPNTPFINGNQNWIAQAGHPIDQRKDTLTADFYPGANAPHRLPPAELRVLRISAIRRRLRPGAEILHSAQPDELAELHLDDQSDHGERSSGDGQSG